MSHYEIPPKLPVPSLSATLDRFLAALKPLLSPTEFAETVRITELFSEKEGPYLQDKLSQLSEETDNWAGFVSVYCRYLSNRTSLLLTNGIGTVLQSIQLGTMGSTLHMLSFYICSNVFMSVQIRNKKLRQDIFDNEPLCMEQYNNLYGVSRVPGLEVDTYCRSPDSRHIIVIHSGYIYKVPVYSTERNEIVSIQEMYNLLSQVMSYQHDTSSYWDRNIGVLTALSRDQWYTAREHLMVSHTNRESLGVTEGCLFGICLDDYELGHLSTAKKLNLGLFGDLKNPFFNRWYGLCLQSMVSKDGFLSVISEHSLIDGTLATVLGYSDSLDTNQNSKLNNSPRVELLKWDISPFIQSQIEKARILVDTICKEYDTYTFEYKEYGKEFVKNLGIYFQGYIQLALQLAYYKSYHGLAPSYQPVSLRKFRGGRLEHPHIVTEESKLFVETMGTECSDKEKYKLMKIAMDRHKEILSDASQGQAYCKHMLGLKMIADREGVNVELFQNESFKIFTNHNLATSLVYRTTPTLSAHPIPSRIGHFVVFKVEDASINFSITTLPHSEQKLNSQEFGASIYASMNEIQQLVATQATNGMLESKL